MKKALITGVTGQDGSYLSELLLENGYEVFGMIRKSSVKNTDRLEHVLDSNKFHLCVGDMTDSMSIYNLISKIKPDEIYNLAAQSHVQTSFELPDYTSVVDALGPGRILEAVRRVSKESKFYQAGSVEIFSGYDEKYTEGCTVFPKSIYGISKAHAYFTVNSYRDVYGIYGVNGLLFNHESPRRGHEFVTKKISNTLCKIKNGLASELVLGNIDIQKDWGHAKDFVLAEWLMMQVDEPSDYIVATGEQHSVREFVEICCKYFGFDLNWHGSGEDEIGVDSISGNTIVRISKEFFRPVQGSPTLGDYSKLNSKTGWKPTFTFEQIAVDMCEAEERDSKR